MIGRKRAGEMLFFAAAAVILTWPLAWSPGRSISAHSDYLSNIWNIWWVRTALLEQGVSPFWTDYLHYPTGLSLAYHTLSIGNSLCGALLSYVMDLHDAYKVLLLTHFWLAGWIFFLFARDLTGSRRGALLAGLIWSFCPFHWLYVSQINVATLEFLPLAALFLTRTYRAGGVCNVAGVALSAGLLAATSSYYLVYAAGLGALLLVSGPLWSPGVPFASGARRMLVAGACAGVAAALVAWPLLSSADPSGPADQSLRANDLLGFQWPGPPEAVRVSWPTTFGYSSLLLLAAGFRQVARQWLWVGFGLVFFVLSLGATLMIGGRDTGVSLPWGWVAELPILSLLHKTDRFILMTQFCLALLCAFAWKDLCARLPAGRARRWLWALVAVAIAIEFSAAPMRTIALRYPAYLGELREAWAGRTLVELPVFLGHFAEAHTNLHQTVHGLKIAQGYVTSRALPPSAEKEGLAWSAAWRQLSRGRATLLTERLAAHDIDIVVYHKTVPRWRRPHPLHGTTVWAPFRFAAGDLLAIRQERHFVDRPLGRGTVRVQRSAIAKALGPPVFEDDEVAVFTADRPGSR